MSDTFRPIVLLPTYNNARTLLDILQRVRSLNLPILVVNDGSTDATPQILADWQSQPHSRFVQVLTHPQNRGKASALKSGFTAARDADFTHAITIDTDGQLDPEQIPAMLELARANPSALVVGDRDVTVPEYPARSRLGRRISNFFVYLESGTRVSDSQCGLRVYPLAFIHAVPSKANYFGFETEVITRAGWAGTPVLGSPVPCRYLSPSERVSHFRPVLDSVRSVFMHLRLLGRALLPIPHRKWPPPAPDREAPSEPHPRNRSIFRQFLNWLSPARAYRELQRDTLSRTEFSSAIAIGVFIGNLPIYGLQSLTALYTARRLHLHPLAVLLGSQISTPPLNAILAICAVICGHVLLHGRVPSISDYDVPQFLLEWTLGAILIGAALATLAFLVSSALFQRLFTRSQPGSPQTPAVSPSRGS